MAAVTFSAASFAGHKESWALFWGDERAYIGRVDGTDDLTIFALKDLNLGATHLRFGALDGNYELESDAAVRVTRITAYDIGTPKRKPLTTGGTDQDVTGLIVEGKAAQKNALQEWRAGIKKVAEIDSLGRLTLNAVRLELGRIQGRLAIIATLSSGERFAAPLQRLR